MVTGSNFEVTLMTFESMTAYSREANNNSVLEVRQGLKFQGRKSHQRRNLDGIRKKANQGRNELKGKLPKQDVGQIVDLEGHGLTIGDLMPVDAVTKNGFYQVNKENFWDPKINKETYGKPSGRHAAKKGTKATAERGANVNAIDTNRKDISE